jgi:hypothetical protein
MGNCLSFARLVIHGCAQPLYKRIHHRKMVNEIKKQYCECKIELLAIFRYVNYKIFITSNIWTAGKYGLGYFRTINFSYTAQIIYQSIINILQ